INRGRLQPPLPPSPHAAPRHPGRLVSAGHPAALGRRCAGARPRRAAARGPAPGRAAALAAMHTRTDIPAATALCLGSALDWPLAHVGSVLEHAAASPHLGGPLM